MWECLFDKLHASEQASFCLLKLFFFPRMWNIFFVLLDHLEHFYLTCLWDSQVDSITHMLCACWTGWRASRSLRGKHRFLSSLHKLCIQLQSLRDKDFLGHCGQVCFLSTDLTFLLAHPYPTTAFLHRGYLLGTKTTAFSNASTHQTVSKLRYLNRDKK